MEYLVLGLTVLVLSIFTWLQYKQISYLTEVIRQNGKQKEKIDSSPNQLPSEDANVIEFNEENFPISPGLKFEVEGGDSMAPPGYQEVNDNAS